MHTACCCRSDGEACRDPRRSEASAPGQPAGTNSQRCHPPNVASIASKLFSPGTTTITTNPNNNTGGTCKLLQGTSTQQATRATGLWSWIINNEIKTHNYVMSYISWRYNAAMCSSAQGMQLSPLIDNLLADEYKQHSNG